MYPKPNNTELLVNSIDNLIIVSKYRDVSRVGKDDYESSHLILTNFSDEYIKLKIQNILDLYYNSDKAQNKFCLQYEVFYTFNGLADYPREAFTLSSSFETSQKLWILNEILKDYNITEHLNSHTQGEYQANYFKILNWFTLEREDKLEFNEYKSIKFTFSHKKNTSILLQGKTNFKGEFESDDKINSLLFGLHSKELEELNKTL